MMSSHFVQTWTRTLTPHKARVAQKLIAAIDPTMVLVADHYEAGNDIRMWLERPDDHTNNHLDRRAANERCTKVVEDGLSE